MLHDKVLGLLSLSFATEAATLSKKEQERVINILKEEGFANKQISRVTGILYGVVRKR